LKAIVSSVEMFSSDCELILFSSPPSNSGMWECNSNFPPIEVLFTQDNAKAKDFESKPIIPQESKFSAFNHGLLTHGAKWWNKSGED